MSPISPHSLRHPSVVLVSLPWTCLTEPSLGLGILRAILDKEEIPCRVVNLNIFLLEHLQAKSYTAIAYTYALNDFLFSWILDPVVSGKQRQWLRLKTADLLSSGLIDYRQYGGVDGVIEQLLHLRQEIIPKWLNRWADQIAGSNATLVGFTCMFDQTIASLALAQLVKQRSPEKMIVFGGYAVHSPTGEALLKAFPFIDVICTGEGEPMIAGLARASAYEIQLDAIPNILYRGTNGSIHATGTAPYINMNNNPIPNFDDFFSDLKVLADIHKVEIKISRLPVENSRGCWWGQKNHCIFCGIHDKDLAFRAPDAERLLEVMDTLANRYVVSSFRLSGYILPYQYFKTLMPELVQRGCPYHLSSEIKANVNASQANLLAASGFNEVQPGIESFSSDVLDKMHKGVSAVQNVYTLLLGRYYGIKICYNILYGIPDDDPKEIADMVRALPHLFHLDPPASRVPIQITRYAPIQVFPERFGISATEYEPSYDLIFSQDFLNKTGFNLNDFCYYFDRPYENSPNLNRLYSEIDDIVAIWKSERAQREVSLWYHECSDGLEIHDSRIEPPKLNHLTAEETFLYRLMSSPITLESLHQRCREKMDDAVFNRSLKRLDQLCLLFHDRDKVIGLALPEKRDKTTLSALI